MGKIVVKAVQNFNVDIVSCFNNVIIFRQGVLLTVDKVYERKYFIVIVTYNYNYNLYNKNN
jgi:hypothetical protein